MRESAVSVTLAAALGEVMSAVLYGIKNCDTVKKAVRWLEQRDIAFEFIDFKCHAPTEAQLQAWLEQVPQERLINRRSTTWKQLRDEDRLAVDSGQDLSIIAAQPALIKRPLLELGSTVAVGFTPEHYASIFDA